jgi:hypothetical protein
MKDSKGVLAKVVQFAHSTREPGACPALAGGNRSDVLTDPLLCPGIGENALHSHTKDDHIFVVMDGTAQFNTAGTARRSEKRASIKPSYCPQAAIISSATRERLPS